MTNPCKDCPRRSAACHADCDDYAAWNALHQAAKAKDRQKQEAEEFTIEICVKVRERKRRRIKGR